MFLTLLLTATILTTSQGRTLQVTVPEEPGVKSVTLKWGDRNIPFATAQGKWATLLGVDLDTKAGEHSSEIVVTFADGRVDKRPLTIRVDPVKYPTTQLKVDDQFVQLSPANQKRSAAEAKELEGIYAKMTPEILWAKPFRVPVSGQTQGSNFGHRRVFNGQARAPHAGSDLKAKTGTPIHATNRGRVVLAKNLFFSGNTVILDHGLGVFTVYAHLSRIDVKPSQIVDTDQLLGLAGATGRVTGPHLHWAARIQGARVDPFSLLSIE
jgi:murein DD-endopeptidase MepM/ murein hydrolase activator NlpD